MGACRDSLRRNQYVVEKDKRQYAEEKSIRDAEHQCVRQDFRSSFHILLSQTDRSNGRAACRYQRTESDYQIHQGKADR